MSEVLIVIPARYGSTRLSGKALKLLAGKPVVQHVWQACVKAGVGEVLIATENQIVVDAAAQFGAKAVLTSESCQSGTDRVYEAAQNRPERIIINVQGDEPFISPSTVQKIARLLQADPQCDIASAVAPTLDENKINDPNCVKAVLNKEGRALYFSRSRVPYKRELTEETGYTAKNWQDLGCIFTSPGYSDEKLYLYKATDLEFVGECPDEGEILIEYEYTPDEIKNMIKNGEITDAKTICAVMRGLE